MSFLETKINDNICRRFSLLEIQSALGSNFNNATVIGRGGFGEVYKGFIADETKTAAIKRLNTDSKQGIEEFLTEIKTLSKLRHINLVPLIGYCDEDKEKILVYEYMPHGTLADHLYRNYRKGNKSEIHNLAWEERLKICIGAARGLNYLHTGTDQSVIHRDVKTANILLDQNWVPKISDFGLSKMGTSDHIRTHFSTQVKGTFGYLDPTYFLTGRLTVKSDVYAFGVILFEVLCGRPPLDLTVEADDSSLVLWAQRQIKKGAVHKIIDPSIKEQISTKSLVMYVELAKKCLHSHIKGRPTMGDVARGLELVLGSIRHEPRRKDTIRQFFLSVPKGIKHGWRELKSFNCKQTLSRKWDRDPFADIAYQSCRRFSIAEIKSATNNFDNHLTITENDCTRIYKGLIERGRHVVAIKRWKKGRSNESLNMFSTEIQVTSQLFHLHVVSVIGYCVDKEELIIVYEYMVNGSLSNHLYGSNHDPLSWERRLDISIDAARGLQYLHSDTKHPIIHRNLKLTSILLDIKWTAKIGGLSFPLVVSDDSEISSFDDIVEGELGYICPDYVESGRCSIKSDVYSFGVILLELVCRRRPMMINLWNEDQVNLVRWFKTSKELGMLNQILDPDLIDIIAPECLKVYISIIEDCVSFDGAKRPSMEDVLDSLRNAMRIQMKWRGLNKDLNMENVLDDDLCKEGADGVSFRNSDDSDYLSVNLAR